MKEADADIFCINETHADKINAKNNRVLESSRRRMSQSKESQYCNLVSSSSIAPITKYTKSGGNMMGISGPLVSRMCRQIKDKYGQWCGFVLLGKDNKEIIILTAYNVPQGTPAGDNTLNAQQTSLYLIDGGVDPNPRKNFICDLHKIVTEAKDHNQDIILMGDFNEVVGDDPKMMAKVLAAGNLTDIHAHKQSHANIATYIRGR